MSSDQALERIGPPHRDRVEEFRSRLRATLGDRVRDLRLFGSHARGDAREDSDVDLLVLVDVLDEATWRSILDMAHSISPLLTPLIEEFDRYHAPRSRATGIYQDIRKDSVPL